MTPWKIGHRGACGHAPENTILSLRKALELGADGVECDVHCCKSGEAVVIHDDILKRTTNGRGRVDAYSLCELRTLDAGEGEKIPTLEEYINAIGKAMLFIEIKTPAAVDAVIDRVTHYCESGIKAYSQLPVISFLWEPLMEIRKRNPRILIGATPPERRIPPNFLANAQAAGMWSVNPRITLLNAAIMAQARDRNLKVITWTANAPRHIKKAHMLQVDGIISDYPDRL